jgi:hypothetical protein
MQRFIDAAQAAVKKAAGCRSRPSVTVDGQGGAGVAAHQLSLTTLLSWVVSSRMTAMTDLSDFDDMGASRIISNG